MIEVLIVECGDAMTVPKNWAQCSSVVIGLRGWRLEIEYMSAGWDLTF